MNETLKMECKVTHVCDWTVSDVSEAESYDFKTFLLRVLIETLSALFGGHRGDVQALWT